MLLTLVPCLQGFLEVMLDRTLNQDDERGLSEAVRDTVPTTLHVCLLACLLCLFACLTCLRLHQFALQFEDIDAPVATAKTTVPNPSLAGHRISDYLNHPVSVFHAVDQSNQNKVVHPLVPLKVCTMTVRPASLFHLVHACAHSKSCRAMCIWSICATLSPRTASQLPLFCIAADMCVASPNQRRLRVRAQAAR